MRKMPRQEILVRVVTRLSQFDFRSRLKTWVYRVSVNYILDVKKSPVERLHLTFDRFAEDLIADVGLALERDHVLEAGARRDGDRRVGLARVLVADVLDEE
jgi:DNA-directed RNA polymerase specialized sigma24 family protein